MKKIFILLIYSFVVFKTSSQTTITTINYLKATNLNATCNVFNPTVTVSGLQHSSWAGGVVYNSSNGIGLASDTYGGSSSGTAYLIGYTFTFGNQYTISITAKGNNKYISVNAGVIASTDKIKTNSTTACSSDPNVPDYSTKVIGVWQNSAYLTGDTVQTVTFPTFSVPNDQSYQNLVIWSNGGDPSYTGQSLFIDSIKIIKKATAPTFSLSSSLSSLTCGSTTSDTLTVTGNNVPAGASVSYKWKLGSNNSWLYNGSAADTVISTTTNQLILTPSCGSALSSISATATVNGTNTYNSNAVTVPIAPPQLSISGVAGICNGSSSYTVSGLPCNASVEWSVNPSGIANLQSNGNSATLTKSADGQVILKAKVSNVCGGGIDSVQKTIDATEPVIESSYQPGNFHLGSDPLNPPSYEVCRLQSYNVYANVANVNHVSWSGPSGSVANWGVQGNNLTFYLLFVSNQPAIFQVTGGNGCGSITRYVSFTSINCSNPEPVPCNGTLPSSFDYFTSPNPASSTVTITPITPNYPAPVNPPCDPLLDAARINGDTARLHVSTMATNTGKTSAATNNKQEDKAVIKFIQVFDETGKMCKRLQYAAAKQAVVDVSGLPNGIYFISISNGEKTVQKKIIVQH